MKNLITFMLTVLVLSSSIVLSGQPAKTPTEVLIVVGPSNHPPGSHEVAAGGRLMAYCLEHAGNLGGVKANVVYEWPRDPLVLKTASSVVFIGDRFPPAQMKSPEAIMMDLTAMMKRGCGMVCLHFATGLGAKDVAEEGDHPLLHWIGGYFAAGCKHHKSYAKIFTSTIHPAKVDHPVLNGWKAFTLKDEPYYQNYFGPKGMADHVTPLATGMLPPEAPRHEVVAWATQRKDGGRGMGIVMPHYFRSWQVEDLRTLILNGIVWTAKINVPKEGVQSKLPELARFKPASIDP